jgi:hypothetical protein
VPKSVKEVEDFLTHFANKEDTAYEFRKNAGSKNRTRQNAE